MNRTGLIFNFFALALSVIVLSGSIGININFHICQDKVKTFSLFGQAEQCFAMEENIPCKTSKSSTELQRKKCCSNLSIYEKVSIQTDILIQTSSKNLVLKTNPFQTTENWIINRPVLSNWFHPPPPRRQDTSINILHQTFLI
ncbi:MAG: hypothetical protein COA58_12490 [Bacteroidetes bacterium]|nr:MAG: hypothetical protein COA58_12490 [Bacteroidota bacterium]